MCVAGVQLTDRRQRVVERRGRRQPDQVGPAADVTGRLQLAADVDGGGRIVAGEDDPESGLASVAIGERGNPRTKLFTNRIGDGGAVEQSRMWT